MRQRLLRFGRFLAEKIFSGPLKGMESADEALRYLPVAAEITGGSIQTPAILEVGSGAKGITPYLPHEVTGADVAFRGEPAKTLRPVVLSGDVLPFPDRSFDYVVSVDMLEHLPAERRARMVSEIIRVAKRKAIIAVPCGAKAESQDAELDDLHRRARGERDPFLGEHVENGLPLKENVESWIRSSAAALGRDVAVRVQPNVNLKVRDLYMRAWIIRPLVVVFLVSSPILAVFRNFLNFGDCYRQMFIVDLDGTAQGEARP